MRGIKGVRPAACGELKVSLQPLSGFGELGGEGGGRGVEAASVTATATATATVTVTVTATATARERNKAVRALDTKGT